MRKLLGMLLFGLLSGLAALLAVLLKQRNEALEGAQSRIARLEQRLGQLANAAPAMQSEAGAPTRMGGQSVEGPRLSALVTSPEPEYTDAQAAQMQAIQVELAALRHRYAEETSWQQRVPALADVGRSLDKLPRAKLAYANQAVQVRVLPTVADQPQDLAAVEGIGAVYEQRLYNAGIGTYWELSLLDDDALRTTLKLELLRAAAVDLDGVRASARRLAAESDSIGCIWTGQPVDDFEPIKGIGKVYEQRLYNAGIRTYAALAASTPEILHEICQVRAPSAPDFASWIEQARALMPQ